MADLLIAAWQRAATDLGIEVTAPFFVDSARGESDVECVAYVPHFGSENGTIVIARTSPLEPLHSIVRARGIFLSILDEDSYEVYDRELFVETLNDWGWFGSQSPPSWYTGEAWTVDT
jgi:hypothetical protein